MAVFNPKRLQAWLEGRNQPNPQETSERYRLILSLAKGKDLLDLSTEVCTETATVAPPSAGGRSDEGETDTEVDIPSDNPLLARCRELRNLRRIRFVTFHPSFSYEEFVEGIRPSTEGRGREVRRASGGLQAGGHAH